MSCHFLHTWNEADEETLDKEKLYTLDSSPDIIKMDKSVKMSCAEHVVRMWENLIRSFGTEPEEYTPLRKPKRMREDNIEKNLREIGKACWLDSSGLG
jgi:hypothetical protein